MQAGPSGDGEAAKLVDETLNMSSAVSELDIRFPFAWDTFLFLDLADKPSRTNTPPLSHVRLIVARQEAESVLDVAAVLDVSDTDYRDQRRANHQQLDRVIYGTGADIPSFRRPKMRTVSCLVDGDQFATADFANVGWALSQVHLGRRNYEEHEVPIVEGSPGRLTLPSDPKSRVSSYRLVRYDALIPAVFRAKTQDGIAGTFVLVGNDYSAGGLRIGFGEMRKPKHADLITFMSDLAPYRRAQEEKDLAKMATLSTQFKSLIAKLPESRFITDLDLKSFVRLQSATRGAYDPGELNKDKFT
ncbi:hypothetical protein JCM3766R1_006096, partial [Sporobolomyces carnicolor]